MGQKSSYEKNIKKQLLCPKMQVFCFEALLAAAQLRLGHTFCFMNLYRNTVHWVNQVSHLGHNGNDNLRKK